MKEITPQALKERLSQEKPPVLLDVRTPQERNAFNIKGTHIPLNELGGRWQELDPNQEWVVYCHVGMRSAQAVQFLQSCGFEDIANLVGGLKAWTS